MILEAFTKLVAFTEELFKWNTGGRSRDQNALRSEADKWRGEYERAMVGKDFVHANYALSQLRKLRDQALNQSGK